MSILNEREMKMARELARDLVRVQNEKKLTDAFNSIKEMATSAFDYLKKVFERGMQVFSDLFCNYEIAPWNEYNWHVPMKIKATKLPNIKLPNFNLARSNL